jgi:hypothetical protein
MRPSPSASSAVNVSIDPLNSALVMSPSPSMSKMSKPASHSLLIKTPRGHLQRSETEEDHDTFAQTRIPYLLYCDKWYTVMFPASRVESSQENLLSFYSHSSGTLLDPHCCVCSLCYSALVLHSTSSCHFPYIHAHTHTQHTQRVNRLRTRRSSAQYDLLRHIGAEQAVISTGRGEKEK